MPGTAYELWNSRSFDDAGNYTFRYLVTDTDNTDDVKLLVAAAAPATYKGTLRGSPSAQSIGFKKWHAEIKYSPLIRAAASNETGTDPGQQGETGAGGNMPQGVSGATPLNLEYSFSTANGTKRIYAALEHVASHGRLGAGGVGPEQPAPDHRGLINVTENGVEGVDIIAPGAQFTISKKLRLITWGYFKRLLATTARTNDKVWGPFAIDECLCMGATGRYTNSDDQFPWALDVAFGFEPTNEAAITIGDCIVPAGEKHGWYYMWTEFEPQDDEDNKFLVKRPLAVHIERVYDRANFDLMRLI